MAVVTVVSEAAHRPSSRRFARQRGLEKLRCGLLLAALIALLRSSIDQVPRTSFVVPQSVSARSLSVTLAAEASGSTSSAGSKAFEEAAKDSDSSEAAKEPKTGSTAVNTLGLTPADDPAVNTLGLDPAPPPVAKVDGGKRLKQFLALEPLEDDPTDGNQWGLDEKEELSGEDQRKKLTALITGGISLFFAFGYLVTVYVVENKDFKDETSLSSADLQRLQRPEPKE